VLSRALAKDPEDRYATASEFVDELGRALEAPRTASTRVVATSPRRTRTSGARPVAASGPPRRSGAGVLLAALASLILVGVIAFLLLSGGSGGGSDNQASPRSTPKPKASSTPEKTSTPEPTQTATPSPSPSPSPTATAPATSGGQDLAKARQLQVQGYQARLGGDYAKDLQLSQQALDACGNSSSMDPCGYALFEKGLSLNRTGRPDDAIPVLQERLDRFGDNEKGEVAKELKAAQKAAKG
jgi:eukaryotic-like serine/threonine-protein kinase